MGLFAQADWDQLLQQSESLAAKDSHGLPRLQRDIAQVEALSSRLKAKAQRIDSSVDALAATRLLAQEGIDPRGLDRALQTVELKPTYEDVFRVESTTVEEYLQQLHEASILSAIKEAENETISAFDAFMGECMATEWSACKRQLFDASLPERAFMHSSAAPSNQIGLTSGEQDDGQAARLVGREKGYVEAVHALNEASLSGQPYNAVAEFAAAAKQDATDKHRSTIGMLWDVLVSVLGGAEEAAAGGDPRRRSLAFLAGACRYLEAGQAKHMQHTIQANRAQASLGGAPSRRAWVYAYLRLREKDAGPLDFDSPGGADTTWHRIFLCLRAGYQQEAIEEARRAKDAPMLLGQSFAQLLEEWAAAGGKLPARAAADVAEECERQRLGSDRHAWQRASFRYRYAAHALLAGDRKAVDVLVREGGAAFATIEDFMWFMASVVRSAPAPSQAGSGGSRGGTPGRSGEGYRLSDLQAYLKQFPPAHYSQGGREPLLYATVLLLSLQFEALLTFLASDATTQDYRLDAPHIAIALLHHKALEAGSEARGREGVAPGAIIHQYGLQFAARSPALALEYYMLAARALGDDNAVRARLVRELLTQSNAFGFLLGSGGSRGGALDRWLRSPPERQQLLEAVAAECESAAQLDWACELYLYAGAPRPALHLLNLQLSELLEPALHSPAQEEELEGLVRRAAEASSALASSAAPADEAEKHALQQLQVAHQLLQTQQRGDSLAALQLLPELGFIPTDGFRLQRCLEAVAALHPALTPRIPALLVATARALAAAGQVSQLRTVVSFAGNLPQRVSQGVFAELNEIYNTVA